jgi:hypothetical protein
VPPVQVTVAVTVAVWPVSIAEGERETVGRRAGLTVMRIPAEDAAFSGTRAPSFTETQ